MHESSPTRPPASESLAAPRRSESRDDGVILADVVPCDSPCKLRRSERWTAALGAALIAGLFLIARIMVPAECGYGSHRSLGLPACTSVTLLGIRCPTCGMSTAWANFVRGRWWSAMHANVTGLVLAVASVPVGIWLCLAAVEGRWRLLRPTPKLVLAAQLTFIAAALAEWIIRLGMGI
ncbi:MAG: hypothetical protein Kow0040_16350 [Thermogutta sp.]